MTQKRHEIIRQAIQEAGSSYVGVKFIKRDGSVRFMAFNARDFDEIKGTGTTCKDPDVFRVREARNVANGGKPAWRSFRGATVLRIKFKGKQLTFDSIEE